MTPEDFRNWRARLGLTQAGAAAALGMSRRQVQYLEAGESPISIRTALAMEHLASHQPDRAKHEQVNNQRPQAGGGNQGEEGPAEGAEHCAGRPPHPKRAGGAFPGD